MKLRNHQFSTQPQIFSGGYEHPWYKHIKYKIADNCPEDMREHAYKVLLNKPNPPTQQAIEKAKFVDKTYEWDRTNNIRPRNKRST